MQYKADCVIIRDNASLVTPILLCIQYLFLGEYDTRLRNVTETGFPSVVTIYNFATLLLLSTLDKADVLAGAQLDAQIICFIISLLQSSACFEQRRVHHQEVKFLLIQHMVSSLTVGDRLAHRTATYRE
jgi:hypothetical protein